MIAMDRCNATMDSCEKQNMAEDKANCQEPRHIRQRASRAARRSLASISPGNSHSQRQSTLISTLPPEVRNLIYGHALSQYADCNTPSRNTTWRGTWRGHTDKAQIKCDTTLLLTCRMIYYEAHMIPLRSATHHIDIDGSELGLIPYFQQYHRPSQQRVDSPYLRLHRLSSQQGRHLYHLHQELALPDTKTFNKLIRPHLKWKRITWTINDSRLMRYDRLTVEIMPILRAIHLPASCHEVNVELQLTECELSRTIQLASLESCQGIELRKEDGSKLVHTGTTKYSRSKDLVIEYDEKVGPIICPDIYEFRRLTWRSGVPKREYTSFDRVRCLEENLAESTVAPSSSGQIAEPPLQGPSGLGI
ncbi:hypothetical protein BDV96DRAFT_256797 [Lophiotrema nucula]|uniref:Uncharacterized protein n=1 Tax=Lophiotrema nucula TaxID=690887 RepID=A0A6A5YNP4_9PLEO|nr:hypothetical protein BDV96DRAFT_256797 [Lophiotrema nucula]